MAKSGIITRSHCSNSVVLSIEWATIENPVDNTVAFTLKAYYDNTNQFGACNVKATDESYNYFQIYNAVDKTTKKYHFTPPAITQKKKHLLATITTDALPAGIDEQDFVCTLRVNYYLNDKIYISSNANYNVGSLVTSDDITVDGIKRAATMEIFGDYTLEVENEISVDRKRENFTHSIAYECGTESGLICSKSTEENIRFSLPVSLSAQSTEKTTVNVVFSITTYYESTEIKTNTVAKTYAIPESVKPSCVIDVEDGERLIDKYGGYVQGWSRFVIETTPSLAYNSPIDAFSINANGEKHNSSVATTSVLKYAGNQEITATVTDKRGRTSPEASVTIDVIPWEKPRVSDVRTARCDENGELTSNGGYLKVTFDAEISPVNNRNSAKYVINYQKTSGIGNNIRELTEYGGQYSITGGVYIFEAEKNASYAVSITAYDDFDEGTRSTGGATAVVLMNLLASGLGLCFGNIATLDGVCEIAFKTYPSGGFMFPTLESGTVYYSITTPNIYLGENAADFGNMPEDLSGAFVLAVLPFVGTSDFLYILISNERKLYFSTLVKSSISGWDEIAHQSDCKRLENRINMLEVDVENLKSRG